MATWPSSSVLRPFETGASLPFLSEALSLTSIPGQLQIRAYQTYPTGARGVREDRAYSILSEGVLAQRDRSQ
jgi:hypothetical protein